MSSEPDWNLHRTFLAILEEGSLSRAARRLGLTQPTVTRHIDALEAAIGTDLFLRSPRGLIPTELALNLLPHARTLAATTAAFMRAARSTAGEVQGVVRISVGEVVGVETLPTILAELRRRYPRLVLELVISNAVDDLLRRDADIAVRMTTPTQEALIAQRLAPIELGLHARRDYLERRGVPTTLADLHAHDLIGFDVGSPALHALVAPFPVFAQSAYALRTDNDLAQLAAIRAGFGIGMCQVAVAHRDAALVRVLADDIAPQLGLWIVMHEDSKTSACCRAVFDGLVQGMTAASARA